MTVITALDDPIPTIGTCVSLLPWSLPNPLPRSFKRDWTWKLFTRTYRKKTTANTLLKAGSHHPKSLIKGTPTGKFLRICQTCALNSHYQVEAAQLYDRFRERNYPHRTLRRSRRKASQLPRSDLLKVKESKEQTQGEQQNPVSNPPMEPNGRKYRWYLPNTGIYCPSHPKWWV